MLLFITGSRNLPLKLADTPGSRGLQTVGTQLRYHVHGLARPAQAVSAKAESLSAKGSRRVLNQTESRALGGEGVPSGCPLELHRQDSAMACVSDKPPQEVAEGQTGSSHYSQDVQNT